MRIFCRIEVSQDDGDADPRPFERIVSDDVDVALFIRDTIQVCEREYGAAWECDLHIEPIRELTSE